MTHPVPPPPALTTVPAEPPTRYLEWLAARGHPVKDHAREETTLRLGDWGFFEHGPGPGYPMDRAALDRSGHAVLAGDEKSDWSALLSTPTLDAEGALARVAWLYRAAALGPPQVTAPSLTRSADGTLTLEGWLVFPPEMSHRIRLTLVASPAGPARIQLGEASGK